MTRHREIAEHIARDASCAQGEFHQRVLSIIPYLTEVTDEIERLRAAIAAIRKRCDERLGPGRSTAVNEIADLCDAALEPKP